jgi:hypothetical protein
MTTHTIQLLGADVQYETFEPGNPNTIAPLMIVMIPDGRAGEVESVDGDYASVRPWDQCSANEYPVAALAPWIETEPGQTDRLALAAADVLAAAERRDYDALGNPRCFGEMSF